MKRILLTGATGFVGGNIIDELQKKYTIFAPKRHELDLSDISELETFIKNKKIDNIIHCANPTPIKNPLDKSEEMIEKSLRYFMNFYQLKHLVDKFIYFGSGAEYGKDKDIINVTETEIGKKFPYDSYGFAKYLMNMFAEMSENIYNLRLFGCYGPNDHESKFITHAIHCCMEHKDITIRQNCTFDYLHVYDIIPVVCYMLDNSPKYHAYNVCSGKAITLVEIAQIVKNLMKSDNDIVLLKEGLNYEYTASNERLQNEIPYWNITNITDGIKMQIEYEMKGGKL